jgi:hypothetical protein
MPCCVLCFPALQAISQLSLELDSIEKRLREAARSRENKLKQAKAPEGRATMPFQLRSMDEVGFGAHGWDAQLRCSWDGMGLWWST